MSALARLLNNLTNKTPKLLIILALLAALALNKGLIFGLDIRPDGEPTRKAVVPSEMINAFYSAPMSIITLDSIIYEVKRSTEQANPTGFVISTAAYTTPFHGFGGHTPVAIFTDSTMVIRGVQLLANGETERFVERLSASGFFDQWNGVSLYDPLPAADVHSGATYTARSVIANVDKTLTVLLDKLPIQRTFCSVMNRYWGEVAILLVVVLAFIFMIFPATTRRLRVPFLLLTIGVLGVWQGAFVSLDLLYKWLIYGTSPAAHFGAFAVVLTSLLVPLFTDKAFYCSNLCPFGAAQELVGKVGCAARRRTPLGIPQRLLSISRWVRIGFLLLLVGLLLLGKNIELDTLEPFTLFLIRSASLSAVIIGGVSLVASFFVQRPWCRLLCPTGEILSLLKRRITYRKTDEKDTK